MNSNLSSKEKSTPIVVIITLAVSSIFIIIALLTSGLLYKKTQYLDNSWAMFQNDTTIKKQFITELNYSFVSGRLLDDIKRYVLSPDRKSETYINARLSNVKDIINQYKQFQDLSAIESHSLLSISNELKLIENSFFLVKKFGFTEGSERYTTIVNKLSSKKSQAAVDALLQFNIIQTSIQDKQIKQTLSQIFWLIAATLLVVPLIIFFLVSYWLSRHHVTSNILAQSNRNELNKLFKYSAIPTVIVNRSGDIVSANTGACDLTGYSMNHLLSKHLEQLIVKAPTSFLEQIMTPDEVIKPKEMSKLLTSKEQEILVEIDITQMLEGSQLLSIVSFRNINNEQQTIKKLTDDEEMYNFTEIVNNIGSWRWDFANDQLTWSPSMYELYGFTQNDIQISQEITFSCIPSDEREDVSNAINESVIFGSELNIKHHIQHQNGQLIYIHQQGRIIKDETGKARYMLGSVTLEK